MPFGRVVDLGHLEVGGVEVGQVLVGLLGLLGPRDAAGRGCRATRAEGPSSSDRGSPAAEVGGGGAGDPGAASTTRTSGIGRTYWSARATSTSCSHLLAPVAVDLVSGAELGPLAVGTDEPARLEQRLGLGAEPADDLIAPGLHQLVPGGKGRRRSCSRWGHRLGPGGS